MPQENEELPSTLQKSPKKIQDTYRETLQSAHEQYHDEERAHRTAWSAVKNIAKKHGNTWVMK